MPVSQAETVADVLKQLREDPNNIVVWMESIERAVALQNKAQDDALRAQAQAKSDLAAMREFYKTNIQEKKVELDRQFAAQEVTRAAIQSEQNALEVEKARLELSRKKLDERASDLTKKENDLNGLKSVLEAKEKQLSSKESGLNSRISVLEKALASVRT